MPEQIGNTVGSGWLNPRRIKRQALLLAIALWLIYAVTLATPGMRDRVGHLKGADFLHSYVLGSLALEHRGDALYDAQIQRQAGEQLVPESRGDWFLPVYAPQYSLVWMPFALLPYGWSAALWGALSAAIYAACCYSVWRKCPALGDYGSTVALSAAAFPGFFTLITFGQNSALALAAFAGAYFALRTRREILAGFCLGLLAYKPQLALASACVVLAVLAWPPSPRGNWREGEGQKLLKTAGTTRAAAMKIMLGGLVSVCVQFAQARAWYGAGPLRNYLRVVTHIGAAASILEPKPYLMHSLRAFWNLLLPWPGLAFLLYILSALATLAVAIASWRSGAPLTQRCAVMLLATVLVAPHLTVYDLVILAPAVLWIADWLASHADSRIAWLLYLSCLLPFAGPLARWTHLQLSVISLAWLTGSFGVWLCRGEHAGSGMRTRLSVRNGCGCKL